MDEALRAWRAALGDDAVLVEPQRLSQYEQCTSGAKRSVRAVLRPRNAQQVQEVVKVAARFALPLHPVSTGHNWGYGTALAPSDGAVVVDLSAMRAISDFDEDLGVVTVEPGVTQGALAAFLAERKAPFLVPVTGAGPSCSLLANALERGYGITPVSDHASAVMGLEAVLADGTVYRPVLADLGAPQAAQVYRWGIGPYLNGLFLQSGNGIVTRMTLALARRPEVVKAFVANVREGEALERVVEAVRGVLRKVPGTVGGINLLNAHRVLAMAVPYPAARLGADGLIPEDVIAALKRERDVSEWTVYGTLYGTRGSVSAAQGEIRRALRPLARRLLFLSRPMANRLSALAKWLPGALGVRFATASRLIASSLQLVEGEPNETALALAYWGGGRRPQDGVALDPARDGCGLIWYAPLVPMRPEVVRKYVDFVVTTLREHGVEPLVTLTSLSERCFDSSVPLLFDRGSVEATQRAQRCYMALLERGRQLGFVPYRVHVDAMSWLTGQRAAHWDIAARLKSALDPQGIISPGRYSRAAAD